MYCEEGREKFTVRQNVLGHMQQVSYLFFSLMPSQGQRQRQVFICLLSRMPSLGHSDFKGLIFSWSVKLISNTRSALIVSFSWSSQTHLVFLKCILYSCPLILQLVKTFLTNRVVIPRRLIGVWQPRWRWCKQINDGFFCKRMKIDSNF